MSDDRWASRLAAIAKDTGAIGAAAIIGARFNKAAIELRIRGEQAAMRLAAVTAPEDRGKVLDEVRRRTELMGEIYAYESVADDVMAGRWPR